VLQLLQLLQLKSAYSKVKNNFYIYIYKYKDKFGYMNSPKTTVATVATVANLVSFPKKG
jgi:hypothetical protein